jgi:uncharacterized damage-inducible protein DinB
MKHREDLKALEHCRAILLRVVKDFTPAQLDWLVLPDSKSIGEILLHVAAFEYLMVSSVRWHQEKEVDHELWSLLKAGFDREAGFGPPRGLSLRDYEDRLGRVRLATMAFFERDGKSSIVNRDSVEIAGLASELARHDRESPERGYELLRKGVGTSFRDDGAVRLGDMVDLAALLQLHETYHRGQVTFQKYLHERSGSLKV